MSASTQDGPRVTTYLDDVVQPETLEMRAGLVGPRPNILLMIDSLGTGGSERQFATLAKTLDPEMLNVQRGCLRKTGAFLDGLGEVAEFDVGGSFYTLRAHRARRALARHLRCQKATIAHSFDFYSNMMMIPVARWARVPIVIGSH